MNLLEYLAIAAALLPVLYIWCKPLGVCAILLAFMVPGYIYVWAGLEIVTYLWSWALPLAAGLIVLTRPTSTGDRVAEKRRAATWRLCGMPSGSGCPCCCTT